MVAEFALGDTLTLRKVHPCGGTMWRIERMGADIGPFVGSKALPLIQAAVERERAQDA